MYDKPMLSLDQTQKAMNAMLAKANEEPGSRAGRGV